MLNTLIITENKTTSELISVIFINLKVLRCICSKITVATKIFFKVHQIPVLGNQYSVLSEKIKRLRTSK
jgi:hypothetical protein